MNPVFARRLCEELSGSRQLALSLVLLLLPLVVIATDQLIVGPESSLLVDEIYNDSLGWRDSVEQGHAWRRPEPEQKGRISWGYHPVYESLNTGHFDPVQRGPAVLNETRPATLFRADF